MMENIVQFIESNEKDKLQTMGGMVEYTVEYAVHVPSIRSTSTNKSSPRMTYSWSREVSTVLELVPVVDLG
ncbi:MAG: hypothetical protein ACW98F_05960 [Candidatus Hodarchaeales archaeon]